MVLPQGTKAIDAILVLSVFLQLVGVSRKGAHILIWNPSFCESHLGDIPQDAWLWWSVRLLLLAPQDCIYLHTFKSSCLKVWFPVSLNLGAEILH